MIYVMGDIHGMYDKYIEMLDKIHFSENDILYVLGDMIDRGDHSIKVLKHMMSYSNIYGLCGNHEVMAIRCLRLLMKEITEETLNNLDTSTLNVLSDWLYNGGTKTLEEFKLLSLEEKQDIMEYLYDLSLYEEIYINDKSYVLVHGGLGHFSEDKDLDDYDIHDIVWERPNYSKGYYKDKYVIVGHTPTLLINGKPEIFHMNRIINVDCGACSKTGRLACLCLDTMEEFYI